MSELSLIWVRGQLDGPLLPSYMGTAPEDMGALPLAVFRALTADTEVALAFGGGNQPIFGSTIQLSSWLQRTAREALTAGDFEKFQQIGALARTEVARLRALVELAHLDTESDMICFETPLIIRRAAELGASKVIDIAPRQMARSVADSVTALRGNSHVPNALEWEHVVAQTG